MTLFATKARRVLAKPLLGHTAVRPLFGFLPRRQLPIQASRTICRYALESSQTEPEKTGRLPDSTLVPGEIGSAGTAESGILRTRHSRQSQLGSISGELTTCGGRMGEGFPFQRRRRAEEAMPTCMQGSAVCTRQVHPAGSIWPVPTRLLVRHGKKAMPRRLLLCEELRSGSTLDLDRSAYASICD